MASLIACATFEKFYRMWYVKEKQLMTEGIWGICCIWMWNGTGPI